MAVEKVEQVRSRNFQLLFAQFKEGIRRDWPKEPERGMLKRFAERLGMSRIYLSAINNDHKIIGTETRDKIEAALKLPAGWMDTDHSQESLLETDDARDFQQSVMALYSQAPEKTKSGVLKLLTALVIGKPLDDVK